MVFSSWISVMAWVRSHLPTRASSFKPHMNFITLHYTYIVGSALIISVVLYGNGNHMRYIDALFFASGCATQSGLNTLNVNQLPLYTQIVMYLSTCFCTPIFINTIVVVVRLYWFEKRFQNVIIDRTGRTRSISRRKSDAFLGRDLGHEERGVGNREIRVMRAANGHAERGVHENNRAVASGTDNAGNTTKSYHDGGGGDDDDDVVDPFKRPVTPVHQTSSNIVWADHLSTPRDKERERLRDSVESPTADRLPEKNEEQSIAFVEAQRQQGQKATLWIPGPRDYERGLKPEELSENEQISRASSRVSQDSHPRRNRSYSVPGVLNAGNHPMKYRITIDVPDRRRTAGPSVYNRGKSTDEGMASSSSSSGVRSRSKTRPLGSFLSRNNDEAMDPMPYFSWTPTIGRNSNFVDLTEEQREELGGIEYRALKLLLMILGCYFFGFHILGALTLSTWSANIAQYAAIPKAVGVNPTWWGIFTSASMFNDLGFTLTPDSMVSYQRAVFPLLMGTFLIIIGNTGFPCMLRFLIWLFSKVVPRSSGTWEELRFLLDHPRRCFTLLFPSKANWWLFWVLVLLNGIDLLFFIILDLSDPTVTSLPSGFRFLAGLFQAASTRTAGFAVVDIANLHPAVQVSYLIMMYISIFPIAMSMRQTNVYEEKSLGVWADNDEDANSSYLSQHLRRQLSFDLWFVFLGFFLISIIEGNRLENTNEFAFSLFSVLFEIVSAYGTVGLSLGFPGVNTSFSGQFRPLSKLIIIAMMIRGRHRGLPYALDRAILLPSESLHQKENEDATRRARRSSYAVDAEGGSLSRQHTGRSSHSGTTGSASAPDRFRPQRLKRLLSSAFSAGPPGGFGEKNS